MEEAKPTLAQLLRAYAKTRQQEEGGQKRIAAILARVEDVQQIDPGKSAQFDFNLAEGAKITKSVIEGITAELQRTETGWELAVVSTDTRHVGSLFDLTTLTDGNVPSFTTYIAMPSSADETGRVRVSISMSNNDIRQVSGDTTGVMVSLVPADRHSWERMVAVMYGEGYPDTFTSHALKALRHSMSPEQRFQFAAEAEQLAYASH
jgi:hypothetical protein